MKSFALAGQLAFDWGLTTGPARESHVVKALGSSVTKIMQGT